MPLLVSSFNFAGNFKTKLSVPRGIPAVDLTLRAFALDARSNIVISNEDLLLLR